MAYNELIKNFNRIRDYMREFYVYGFKSREEYKRKSARSYDDERRRVESWLGDYMGFRQTPEGKNVFLSIDSRLSRHNPLYKAWKARSFTDGDMTLHFILLDLLHDPEQGLSLGEITRRIDQDYLSGFEMPRVFDESTVRKKLKEYTEAGILHTQKQGRVVLYFRTPDPVPACSEALDYFSEVLPCGVIGSYLLEEQTSHRDLFAFKHHYITQALDSEILYQLFCAMQEHREVRIESAPGTGIPAAGTATADPYQCAKRQAVPGCLLPRHQADAKLSAGLYPVSLSLGTGGGFCTAAGTARDHAAAYVGGQYAGCQRPDGAYFLHPAVWGRGGVYFTATGTGKAMRYCGTVGRSHLPVFC